MLLTETKNHAQTINISQDLKWISNKIYQLLNTVQALNITKKSLPKLFHFNSNFKFIRSEILLYLLTSNDSHLPVTSTGSNRFLTHQKILDYCVSLELLNLATKIHSLVPFQLNKNNPDLKNNLNSEHQTLSLFGYKISISQVILIGDYLFTIAFEQVAEMNNDEILQQFSTTAKNLVVNEAKLNVYQPNLNNYPDIEITHVISMIKDKYFPLYYQIIYLLNKQHNTECPWFTVFLDKINTFFVLKKLIQKNVILNSNIMNLLYPQSQHSSESHIIFSNLLETTFEDVSNMLHNSHHELSPTYNMDIIKNLASSLFAQ